MAIPDFQSIMLPLLNFCADGREYTNRQAVDALAEKFSLSEEDQKQLLPSGQQRTFENRVAWARAHMKMAGLLKNTRRGVFSITDQGIRILEQNPATISLKFLREIPEYKAARGWVSEESGLSNSCNDQEARTPEERMEEAYLSLRESLTSELIAQLKAASPQFFEQVVVEVLVKMGYGGSRKDAGQAIGRSGDEGIDGIIKEDRLGLDIIYIQAKKWENTISRPEIQKFAGALQGKRARKGIFITTSDFSQSAHDFVNAIDSKIILIDGNQLAQYMIDFGVGVSTGSTYEVKRLDSDYFVEN
ncbi:restriction endonuclease [Desulfonatronum parangueonense]